MEYVDVRGVWPVLVVGLKTWTIQDNHRGITVPVAKALVAIHERGDDRDWQPPVVR